jgi:predicted kinase
MKNLDKPILFILSGLPASGKSTLSKFIVKKYGAIYLRVDTIEQGLRDLCKFDVQGEGYELSYRIANDNLRLGVNVCADACNPIPLTRKAWEGIAQSNACLFVNIEVICSDKHEHKRRAETRKSEIENLNLPNWIEIENREYHQWESERIIIDTANKTVDESINELSNQLEKYLSTDRSYG